MELTGGVGIEKAVSYFFQFSSSTFTPSFIISSLSDLQSPFTNQSLFQNFALLNNYIFGSIMSLFSSPMFKMVEGLWTPFFVVIATEIIVDWLKHAFITKFNLIKPAVYQRFTDSLFKDLVGGDKHATTPGMEHVDQSPAVARRIG
jgi:hypothetical protein